MWILEAKLHAPMLHPEHVPRPRLRQRLDDATARRLTLVDAAAGFGKSTLVAEWCATLPPNRRVAWVTLDQSDNDPVMFWAYILVALHRLEPERIGGGLETLRIPGVSFTRTVLPRLLNELWTLDSPAVLILDDYHLVTSDECHEGMRFFLQRLPPNVRVVISTRSDPPIGLGTLRARGELSEIRAADLRFDESEAASLLNDFLRLGLAPDDLDRLHERTEGWAAGLYLAALSLRDRPDAGAFIADFSGHNRHIVDYLGSEVLSQLPEDTRVFLLRTSILERFSPPLCDEVASMSGSAARLRRQERTNQFLVPLDPRGEWYRYHHLFGELLQVELESTDPDLVPVLHARAAAWHQAAGDAGAAMRHALAAGDFDLSSDLFIQYGQRLVSTGRLATVMNWIAQLPEAEIAVRPRLAMSVALAVATASRPPEEARRWLSFVEGSSDQGPGPLGFSSLQAITAWGRANLFDDVGVALRNARKVVAQEADPTTLSYAFARQTLGQALYFAGRPQEAYVSLEEALRAPLADQQQGMVLRALALRALVCLDLGEIARAEDLVRRSLKLAEDTGQTDYPGMWLNHLVLGEVLFRRGLLDEAETVLEHGVEGRLPGLRAWHYEYAFALLTLAPVRYACGHTRAAQTLLSEARAAIASCRDPGMLPARLEMTERMLHRIPRCVTGLRVELSEGELRILRLLASDLSQREIGRELYLSVNTIKTHTRGIYTKLDVASRIEAIARARSLGLIA
jgi:LuxR family maltose regulon positive regulatory protein